MLLTQSQFDVLYCLFRAGEPLSQRQLHTRTGMSLGRINAVVRECEAKQYIAHRALTDVGLNVLEPFRVKNAVIMAAGLSQRFAPISYERPKGTLKVRGEVLVERQIQQLHEVGITDISLVVGYKKEYFFYLADKYDVKIVVNNDYFQRNNNGSLWCVRHILGNTFVCSSDDYFTVNPFESHVYQAYYSAQYCDGETAEWCIATGPGDRIVGATVGGANAWTMLGHVYFDEAFSTKFRVILEQVYDLPETAPKLWEAIYLEHVKELNMVIRRYSQGVINEFDSVDELRDFDPMFMENVDSEVFDHISTALGCAKAEIRDFYPLKQGITNLSCHFAVGDQEYVYRHPGVGTDKIVDRLAELEALWLARDLQLDTTFVAGDPVKGWKISRFVPQARNLNVNVREELRQAMEMARQLHGSGRELARCFDLVEEAKRYEKFLLNEGPIDLPGYMPLREKVMRLKTYCEADGYPLVPSHNDFFPLNFLVSDSGHIDLIDWEYAGMSDEASDFGSMVVSSNMSLRLAFEALEMYFNRKITPGEQRHFWAHVVFAGWCWYVWALLKEQEGDDVGEWLFVYYRNASEHVDAVLAAYETNRSLVISSLNPDRLEVG